MAHSMQPLVLSLLLATTLVAGCANLHQAQIGQIDNRPGHTLVPFEVMVSETGVSTEEIAGIARAMESQRGNDVAGVAEIIALFQMGPRTGRPIYTESYATKLLQAIHEKCPSGHITGVQSIREARSYPVISGEIVKVTGYCRKLKKELSDGV